MAPTLRDLAYQLDARMILKMAEKKDFVDYPCLVEAFRGDVKSQQELALLQQSRSVRATKKRYQIRCNTTFYKTRGNQIF